MQKAFRESFFLHPNLIQLKDKQHATILLFRISTNYIKRTYIFTPKVGCVWRHAKNAVQKVQLSVKLYINHSVAVQNLSYRSKTRMNRPATSNYCLHHCNGISTYIGNSCAFNKVQISYYIPIFISHLGILMSKMGEYLFTEKIRN
jgi:hypothetical protein